MEAQDLGYVLRLFCSCWGWAEAQQMCLQNEPLQLILQPAPGDGGEGTVFQTSTDLSPAKWMLKLFPEVCVRGRTSRSKNDTRFLASRSRRVV